MRSNLKLLVFMMPVLAMFISFESSAQFFKTQLKVTVIDDAGNLVEGAEIQLYTTEENFNKEENPASEKLVTDEKGTVKFESLESRVYYILVQKGDMNNWNGGIQTDKLQAKKVNKINVVIE